jgi:serine/threonine-protein kinase HipA
MSVLPWNKYENEGGPGIAEIVPLIQESSLEPEADVGRFVDIIALNWVLAATDAHAKNYAILHAPGGGIRLAPFYDVASFLPYSDSRLYKIKLAMRIGREYLARKIGRSDWVKLADASKLSESYVLERLDVLLPLIPQAVENVARRAISEGLDSETVGKLAERIGVRSHECIATLAGGAAAKSTKG